MTAPVMTIPLMEVIDNLITLNSFDFSWGFLLIIITLYINKINKERIYL